MNDVSLPMVHALRDLYDGPVQLRPYDKRCWVNLRTQRALVSRGLAERRRGETLATSEVALDGDRHPAGVGEWLVITPAGRMVLSAYVLGTRETTR